MNLRVTQLLLLAICVIALPHESPAPLIYRQGEGWVYQRVGADGVADKMFAPRAKEQLDIVQNAFKSKDFDLAQSAAKRLVKKWPLSDFAPAAQYYVARTYEEEGKDEKAFKEYQRLLEKYPKIDNYQEVLKRQYEIATRFLNGKKFRLFGILPLYRSMQKTVDMYEKVIANGPYSEIAPQAQMNIGRAHEKQDKFRGAVKAYEIAADRYNDRENVAADGLFNAAETYFEQARSAEYDQGVARKALEAFHDFIARFPDDPRVDGSREKMQHLRNEQARGAIKVAEFYEKKRQWAGALVYYNEALVKSPNSIHAQTAKQKIEEIKALQAKGPAK